MKIAITGANGFLGSRITWTALRGGHEVIALVRRGANLNKLTLHKKLHILEINYNAGSHGIEDFDKILKQHGTLDLFIHNAGLTVSQVEDQYFQVNANLTRQIIKTLEQQKVIKPKGKLVYISSYAAHGPFGADEPVSAYGSSKRQAECIIEESQINHTIIRPTAIYGPGDDAFLPLFKAAKIGIYPLLTPENQMLSMIYVDDLARAIVSSVNSENNVIHFSDGQIYRHSDLKLALEEAIDKPLRRIKIPPKMVKKYLRFSDSISRFMSYAPHLTLEKYEEISSNWNLTDDQALTHQKPNNPIKLTEGFAQTWKYYKSNSLA